MDRHEYRRQNERRDACRDKKLAEESHATKRWWQWRPTWWNIPSDRFAFFVAVFTGVLALVAIWQWSAMRQADQTTRESFSAVQRPFITAIGLNFSQQGYGASTPQYWLFRVRSNSEPRSSSQVTGSRARSFSRAAISRALAIPEPTPVAEPTDYRERYALLIGRRIDLCPCCGGRMVEVGFTARTPRASPDRHARCDTS